MVTERVEEDIRAVLDVVRGGGVAMVPLDVAYAIVGHTGDAIRRIFAVKRRSYDKPSGLFAGLHHALEHFKFACAHLKCSMVLIRRKYVVANRFGSLGICSKVAKL